MFVRRNVLVPTLQVSVDRIKMLLKQNNIDTEAVPIGIMKQAIMRTSSATELKSIDKKIKNLRQSGAIKEVKEGIWRID